VVIAAKEVSHWQKGTIQGSMIDGHQPERNLGKKRWLLIYEGKKSDGGQGGTLIVLRLRGLHLN